MTVVDVYVDDIVVTRNDQKEIDNLKSHLHKVFSIKDLGEVHYFLGMEVSKVFNGMILSQAKFTRDTVSPTLTRSIS